MNTFVSILLLFALTLSVFSAEVGVLPTVSTKNITAHFCPYPCTIGNQTLCYPPPCPLPPCVDPAKHQPTDCCQFCPDGPNCRGPEGTIIKWNHSKIVDGKNCTCVQPMQDAICV